MRNKTLYLFITTFLLVGLGSASAQISKWTYVMKSNEVTYKIHIQEVKGTATVQLYDSKSNKWGTATVLEKKFTNDGYRYYKIKSSEIYEIWISLYDVMTVKGSGGGEWRYKLEKME
ncbi:MAG: hypothetical protein MUC49_14400 [Raineya sp.]|jgi:hypothetical protein|nr:hypothetical protein [Raineya sp.]